MIAASPRATFRDPAGSLSFEGELAVRTIAPSSRAEVIDLLTSPFCRAMQQRGDLIAAEVDDSGPQLILRHPRIPIPTYPWEWAPAQWLAAAELTLNLCEEALTAGWILKDATPLNVLFNGPRPILVDILSFERLDHRSAIWLAYGQFVRTFLLPLLMDRLLHWPLSLTLFRRDGYEPAECFAALRWLPPSLPRGPMAHHSAHPARTAATPTMPLRQRNPPLHSPQVAPPHPSPHLQLALRRRTLRAASPLASSNWSDYPQSLTHYTPRADHNRSSPGCARHSSPRSPHESSTSAPTPATSALSPPRSAPVSSRWSAISRRRRPPLPHASPAQSPHPDHPRRHRPPHPSRRMDESESLRPAAASRSPVRPRSHARRHPSPPSHGADSPPRDFSLCHRLTRRHLLLEWVPPRPHVPEPAARSRPPLWLSQEADLLAACAGRFHLIDRLALTNGRILLLSDKIDAPMLKKLCQSLGLASLILVMNYGDLLGGGADVRMHMPFALTRSAPRISRTSFSSAF